MASDPEWKKIMTCLGSNIVDFFNTGVNDMHMHVAQQTTAMASPHIHVENVSTDGMDLHYYSIRSGFKSFFEGTILSSARIFFHLEVELKQLRGRALGNCDHEVYRLSFNGEPAGLGDLGAGMKLQAAKSIYAMPAPTFYSLFPFHFILDGDCNILQVGHKLGEMYPTLAVGAHIGGTFSAHNLFLSDIPPMDMARDFVLLAEQHTEDEEVYLEQLEDEKSKWAAEATMLEEEMDQAEAANKKLRESLAAALAHPAEGHLLGINTDTPAEKALKILDKILHGKHVTPGEALDARMALLESGNDLRQPVNFRKQMLEAEGMGKDEKQSLLDLLGGGSLGSSKYSNEVFMVDDVSDFPRDTLDSLSRPTRPYFKAVPQLDLLPNLPPSECPFLRADASPTTASASQAPVTSMSALIPRLKAKISSFLSIIPPAVSPLGRATLHTKQTATSPDEISSPPLSACPHPAQQNPSSPHDIFPYQEQRRSVDSHTSNPQQGSTFFSNSSSIASSSQQGLAYFNSISPRGSPQQQRTPTTSYSQLQLPTLHERHVTLSHSSSKLPSVLQDLHSDWSARGSPYNSSNQLPILQDSTGRGTLTHSNAQLALLQEHSGVVIGGGDGETGSMIRSALHQGVRHCSFKGPEEGAGIRFKLPEIDATPRARGLSGNGAMAPSPPDTISDPTKGVQARTSFMRARSRKTSMLINIRADGGTGANAKDTAMAALLQDFTASQQPPLPVTRPSSPMASRAKGSKLRLRRSSLLTTGDHNPARSSPQYRGSIEDDKKGIYDRLRAIAITRKQKVEEAEEDDIIDKLLWVYRGGDPVHPTDKLNEVLARVEEWQFDSFALNEATNGHPLSVLAFHLLKASGLTDRLNIKNEKKLARFLMRVEEGYPDNPYHCSIHAADVLRTLHVILTRGGVKAFMLGGDIGLLSIYLAATVHNYGHRGVNNDYLIKVQDSLAVLYNDHSPLENHHVAATWMLLLEPSNNFLTKMSAKSRDLLRRCVIETVLATDMKQVALKCADLGHLTSSRAVHSQWVGQLEEELFRQGDKEKMNVLSVSPLMDRAKTGITKSQAGFFNIVALPLFQSFSTVLPATKPLLEAVRDNFCLWTGAPPPHPSKAP